MVHLLAFSFTNDSTSVETSRLSTATDYYISSESAHPAMELIRLRKAASIPYVALFRSGLDVLYDPWPVISSAHMSLDEWEQELRLTKLQEATKCLFRPKVVYIKVAFLSPSRLERALNNWGPLLIYGYTIEYSQIISSLVGDQVNAFLCTSYDLLQTVYIAQRTVEVLSRYGDLFFDNSMPPTPKTSAPQSFFCRSIYTGREQLELAIKALSALDNVIGLLGGLYGISGPWIDFRPRFDRVHATLRSRTG